MTLIELRDALAKATGQDWGLSGEIEVALFPGVTWWRGPGPWLLEKDGRRFNPPAYTGSIDAAVTLVERDGWYWRVGHDEDDPALFHVELLPLHDDATAPKVEASAATPALALCLARVKYEIARAEERRRDGTGAAP